MKIKKYFLITDPCIENCNPGDPLIGNGIQYLLNEAEKRLGNYAIFNILNIFNINERAWERAFKEADYIIVCGTPQLSLYPEKNHCRHIWPYIAEAKKRGIICANLWCGSGHPDAEYNIEIAVESIYNKVENILKKYFKYFDLIIVRDNITKQIINKAGYNCTQLIDSVFFSIDYYKLVKQNSRFNLLVPRRDDHAELIVKNLLKLKMNNKFPTYFLCHNTSDYLQYYKYIEKNKLLCINNPQELLKLYSQANQVVSLRVHGSVPALNFEAETMNIAIDSRSNILEYVGLKSVDIYKLKQGKLKLQLETKNVIDIKNRDKERFINLFYKDCQRKVT